MTENHRMLWQTLGFLNTKHGLKIYNKSHYNIFFFRFTPFLFLLFILTFLGTKAVIAVGGVYPKASEQFA